MTLKLCRYLIPFQSYEYFNFLDDCSTPGTGEEITMSLQNYLVIYNNMHEEASIYTLNWLEGTDIAIFCSCTSGVLQSSFKVFTAFFKLIPWPCNW